MASDQLPKRGKISCVPSFLKKHHATCPLDEKMRDSTSPALQKMIDEIIRITNEHKRQKWKQFVETLDNKTDPTKLWRTIKAIYGKSTPKDETRQSHLTTLKYLPQSRSPTISTDSSPLQNWADTLLLGRPD